MTISADRLEAIMRDSMYRPEEVAGVAEGEAPPGAVVVEGVLAKFGFHPARVESHRAELTAMLAQLPDDFRGDGPGGGGSFLVACVDRDGVQWTGMHRSVEQLFVLGMALGLVRCLVARPQWAILPGGMPYYAVDLPKEPAPAATPAT